MTITRDFKLHLNYGSSSPLMIRANQYDSGEIWRFTLFDEDGVKYIPSSAVIIGTTASGALVTREATIESGKVVVEETRTMTQSAGKNEFELVVDDGSHGTANFFVDAEPRPNKVYLTEHDLKIMEGAIEAGAAVGDLVSRVNALANADAALRKAIDDAAIVPAGSTVVVDNTLSIAGAAADAKATGDAVSDLNAALNNIKEGKFKRAIDFSNAINGYYISTNGTNASLEQSANYSYLPPFAVTKGSIINLTGQGYKTSIAMIASYADGVYKPLVISIDSTVRNYSYTATEDMYISLCYRTGSAHSGDVILLLDLNNIAVELMSAKSEKPNYLYLFNKMAGIGDSLMSGELYYSSENVEDVYSRSWLSNLSRSAVNQCVHYSVGGMTTKAWINDLGGYRTALENETPLSDVYFIGLGTNDKNQSKYPIGNISDNVGADSFVGYYKQIISIIRTHNPNAVIFCLSMYDNNSASIPYSEMVEDIADLYSYCYFIDFANTTLHTPKVTDDYANNSHFTSLGYLYASQVIKKLVNEIIDSNKSDFKWIGLDLN